MEHVFVYGILMSENGQAAYVDDHRLRFYGFATCEESDGDRCYGTLLTVPGAQVFQSFDQIEGVDLEYPAQGFYRRERVTVTLLTGGTVEAWVYKMNTGRYGYEGPTAPSRHMVGRMREIYETLGMPADGIDAAVAETVDPFTQALARTV